MNGRAWLLQVRNQATGFLREPAAFVFNLLVPLFMVLVQALANGQEKIEGSGVEALEGLRVVDTLPPAAATMFVMIIGLYGAGVGLSSLIEARTLAGASLRPGGAPMLVSAYGFVLLSLICVGMLLAFAALTACWNVAGPSHLFALVGVLLLASVGFLSTGALVAALVASPRSAQGVCSAAFFPLLFLSGAVFPVDSYPDALQSFATMLPGYHLAELASATWFPDQDLPWASLVYLIAFALIVPLMVRLAFSRREGM